MAIGDEAKGRVSQKGKKRRTVRGGGFLTIDFPRGGIRRKFLYQTNIRHDIAFDRAYHGNCPNFKKLGAVEVVTNVLPGPPTAAGA